MKDIVIFSEEQLRSIFDYQELILKKLEEQNINLNNEKYISRKTAAIMFECSEQLILKLENEEKISRFGRGRFIRYSVIEIKKALGIIE